MDKIIIEDLMCRAVVGINPRERDTLQDIVINMTLWVDIKKSAFSDNIEDSVNYRSITKRVLGFAEASKYYLLEALVENIAALTLDHAGVARVKVRVDKPGALRFTKTVGIEIERERKE